jgi:hypothetical protein
MTSYDKVIKFDFDNTEGNVSIMDSNLYTVILDEQYDFWKENHKVQPYKNLTARFKEECETIPYLQQCKLYDC